MNQPTSAPVRRPTVRTLVKSDHACSGAIGTVASNTMHVDHTGATMNPCRLEQLLTSRINLLPRHEPFRIKGRVIRYLQSPRPHIGYWAELRPRPGHAATFHFEPAGLRLGFQGERPVSRGDCYGIGKAVCLEPFRTLDLAPGATQRWSARYGLGAAEPSAGRGVNRASYK